MKNLLYNRNHDGGIIMGRFFSYLYGLLLTDGSLQKRNGKPIGFSLELSAKDSELIEKLHNKIPKSNIYYRARNTNMCKNAETVTLQFGKNETFYTLLEMGFPLENKTERATIPVTDYDEPSFWRGALDGDGSLGLRANGDAFVSLTTKSEELKKYFCIFLKGITGRNYNPSRNKRDSIYNIGCSTNSAKKVIDFLYHNIKDEDIYMDRKYKKMEEVLLKANGGMPQ